MADELSRRTLLLAGAVAIPVSSFAGDYPWQPNSADHQIAVSGSNYLFFNPEEAAFIEAAVERLIPADESGPGAREAGVALFIDRQLAGGFGMGERTYLGGPFAAGTPTQGYQLHAPAVAYREAIASVNAYARQTGNTDFARLSGEAQDRLLHELESGHAQLNGSVGAKPFFDMLWQNTIEGYFADPLYGGNRGMNGWRMIGFPGAHYDYRPQLAHMHERLDLHPVGVMGAHR
jgi:gluconate 2-dehydrogenase gamma chain